MGMFSIPSIIKEKKQCSLQRIYEGEIKNGIGERFKPCGCNLWFY